MKSVFPFARRAVVLVFGVLLISGQLLAADNDRSKKDKRNESADVLNSAKHDHFDDNRKQLVRNYFNEEKRNLHCPPGLAKKNNGCNPPGQVKRWQVGQYLQQDVRYRVLPTDLSSLLGPPQAGYHYGMVDSDILLLLDGTEMVIDAITNFGQ